jgi:serine protease Do
MDIRNNPSPSLLDRMRTHRLTTTFTLLATLSIGILVGSVLTRNVSGKEANVDTSDAKPLTIPSPVTLSNGFSQIVKQVSPAVVNINTEELPKQPTNARRGRRGMQGPQDGNNDDQQNDMQDFFNRFFGGQPGQGDDGGGMMGNTERRALGSGFIVDPRGYIITNNHVVDKADKIYVKLSTDPEGPATPGRPAHVVGVDKETDIAVIKIDADKPLPTIKLGNSDGAQVGDWVLAIGSPFALSKTVTAGIISAKDRSGESISEPSSNGIASGQFQNFIQTDAAINPGNSGGPLVDMAGQVIGMNTAIYTQSMGSEGVGFAMPSNTIAKVYNDLIGPEHKVVRGSIGISFQQGVSSAVNRMYGFSNGVIVSSVTPNGGAAKAGLQPGDIIISIDGRDIKGGDDLVEDISSRHIGSTVKLGYVRNGKKDVASVVIGDRAKTFADLTGGEEDNSSPQTSDAGETTLGITVSAIPPAIASRTGISKGVIITSVRPGSFADEINLAKGEIITAINKQPVADEASYRAIVSTLKSKDDVVFVVHLPMQRNSGNSYVGGTLP